MLCGMLWKISARVKHSVLIDDNNRLVTRTLAKQVYSRVLIYYLMILFKTPGGKDSRFTFRVNTPAFLPWCFNIF